MSVEKWARHPTRIYFLSNVVVVLAGAVIMLAWDGDIGIGVGASVLASGITGFLFLAHSSLVLRRDERMQTVMDSRVVGVFERRDAQQDEFATLLRDAKESIDVLGYSLRSLRGDHPGGLEAWSRRATIRIMLIDPEFPSTEAPFAAHRDLEREDHLDATAQNVRQYIEYCRDSLGALGESRIRVRLFQCLPSIAIFRVDDVLYWGPYLMSRQSKMSPMIRAESGAFLYRQVRAHFDEIWSSEERSREVPAEWLEAATDDAGGEEASASSQPVVAHG